MGTQVTAIRTPLNAKDVASMIAAVWPSVVGGTPTQAAITTLTTQVNVETGWNSCFNNNVGNLAGTGGDYVMLHASDGTYRPYRAFASLEDGVTAFLTLLNNRYSAALASASAGDLDGFASNLKAQGYYQEPESQYVAALQARYGSVAQTLGTTTAPADLGAAARSPLMSALVAVVGGVAIGERSPTHSITRPTDPRAGPARELAHCRARRGDLRLRRASEARQDARAKHTIARQPARLAMAAVSGVQPLCDRGNEMKYLQHHCDGSNVNLSCPGCVEDDLQTRITKLNSDLADERTRTNALVLAVTQHCAPWPNEVANAVRAILDARGNR